MLDCIIWTSSDWFNQHRKDAVSGSAETKLVPLVENYLHDLWAVARTLPVRELNSYEFEYEVTSSDGNMYLANLVAKSCTCKVWDYENFPCLHVLAAYIYYTKDIDGRRRDIHIVYHELCSKYYWAELWALAYSRTLYVVPDRSSWNVPDHIKEMEIIPPDRITRKGMKRFKRHPSCGERHKKTQNKRRPRQNYGFNWLLFGIGSGPTT